MFVDCLSKVLHLVTIEGIAEETVRTFRKNAFWLHYIFRRRSTKERGLLHTFYREYAVCLDLTWACPLSSDLGQMDWNVRSGGWALAVNEFYGKQLR